MEQIIRPSAVRGTVAVPGDKSISHRALMLGALAAGTSRIRNVADSADCRATLRIVRALGAHVAEQSPGEMVIDGPGLADLTEPADVLDAANSGTTTRLIAGILATRPFFSVITGDASLRERPMGRVVEPLAAMGATIIGRAGSRQLPLSIHGGGLRAIDYCMPVASAQVKSAILLAGLGADGTTRVVEPAASRDHTELMLQYLGVPICRGDGAVEVQGGVLPRPFDLDVPGDISSAAFFLAAALLAPESAVSVPGVCVNPTRTGVIDVLLAMGGSITLAQEDIDGPEPTATLSATTSNLHGVEIGGDLIPRLLDELPLLALVATQAHGRTVVRDAQELRLKESDRIDTTARELRRLGADVAETPDGFVINGPTSLQGNRCQSHGDHRIAMMLAVAGLIATGETVIEGAECIEVSFPGFFGALARLIG